MSDNINWKSKYLKYKLKYKKLNSKQKMQGGFNITEDKRVKLEQGAYLTPGNFYYAKNVNQVFKVYERGFTGYYSIGNELLPLVTITSQYLSQFEIYDLGTKSPSDFRSSGSQFSSRNIFVQYRNELEQYTERPIQVAIIGTGPVGLLLLFRLLTEPFFEESFKLPNRQFNFNLISNKGLNPMNESWPQDMCYRPDVDLFQLHNIGLPTNMLEENESWELQRKQVFLIKEEEFNALPNLIKSLITNIGCGHEITPDRFHSMHCIPPTIVNPNVKYYSMEIRMFEAILWKACYMVIYKENCINNNYIPNKVINAMVNFINIDNFKTNTEEMKTVILPHYPYVFNCAGAMGNDPTHLKANWCGYPNDLRILETDPNSSKLHKLPLYPPRPVLEQRDSEKEMYVKSKVENDNNYYDRPNTGANLTLSGTCKEWGSIFIFKFNNNLIDRINQYAQRNGKNPVTINMQGIMEHAFNSSYTPNAQGGYGNTEFRLFPARPLNPNDLGGIYVGHLLTPEENRVIRDRVKRKKELSEPIKGIFVNPAEQQARRQEYNKFRVLKWTIQPPGQQVVIPREAKIMNTLILKIAGALRRFGISPYYIDWSSDDIVFQSFSLLWSTSENHFYEDNQSRNRLFILGDAGYSAHYLTYSGVNNGLKSVRGLFDIPQNNNLAQTPTNNLSNMYINWGIWNKNEAANYYKKYSEIFSDPKLLTVEGKPNMPLQNLSFVDMNNYINSDFDFFEKIINQGDYLTVSDNTKNYHIQAREIFNGDFITYLDALFMHVQ